MRYLGVDLGERRIGLALSDPTGCIAKPFGWIDVRKVPEPVQAVAEVARSQGVAAVVVGLPRHMNGQEGTGATGARAFAQAIRERLGLETYLEDERLTTALAQRVLIERKMRREKRRQAIDQTAAAIILQGYLDRHGASVLETGKDHEASRERPDRTGNGNGWVP